MRGRNVGHIVKEETKNKISIKLMGRHCSPKSEFKKGQKCSNKGKSRFKSGEEHPLWKDGVTPKNKLIRHSIEFRLWREAVFARDNFTCQDCKIRGSFLHAHHIKKFSQYPELRFAIDNGTTLCRGCHSKTHKNLKIKVQVGG